MGKLSKPIQSVGVILILLLVNITIALNGEPIVKDGDYSLKSLLKSPTAQADEIEACVITTFHFPEFQEVEGNDVFCIVKGVFCGIERLCEYYEFGSYCQQTKCKGDD
jgi:hypothetical protein